MFKSIIKKQKDINQKGITLIALIVTIIVLLILAGITIATLTGDDGIINNANNAKEETEIANEKEVVDRATVQAMGNNDRGDIVQNELQEELDRITKVGDTEVLKDTEDNFCVYFINTYRYYNVDIDGNVEGPVEVLCALSNSCNNGITYSKKYIKLMINLDFKLDLSYVNGKISTEGNIPSCNSIEELKEILTTGEGFCPIGTGTSESNSTYFRGKFNGDYNEIKNLYVNREYKAGLFGGCWSAKVENITIKGYVAVKNDSSASSV